jgi:hypothetical protein
MKSEKDEVVRRSVVKVFTQTEEQWASVWEMRRTVVGGATRQSIVWMMPRDTTTQGVRMEQLLILNKYPMASRFTRKMIHNGFSVVN